MMTIKIERISTINRLANPGNSIFLKPEFRHALAREFQLEAINLHTTVAEQSLTIPAYRKLAGKRQTLIIGAGFDKTS
ncbi:MAG: Unknown protein, partial [uncultured Thiotrichaceae bacterium]